MTTTNYGIVEDNVENQFCIAYVARVDAIY